MKLEPASPEGPGSTGRAAGEPESPAAASPDDRRGQKRPRTEEVGKGPDKDPEPVPETPNTSEKQKQAAVAGAVGDDGRPSASTTVATGIRQDHPCDRHNSMISKLGAARWIVCVSSTAPDGTENLRCSGICIHWNKQEKRARVLTSYRVVFCTYDEELYDPAPKLAVHLPDMDILEAQLLFFDVKYGLALLEISVNTSYELELPSFGCSPCYGQEVFTLHRDKGLSFKLSHHTIVWLEEDQFLFQDLKLPNECAIGGSVINHNGDVIGMLTDDDLKNPPIMSITTILTCIEMWATFGRIARPKLGMCFRTVELLDMGLMDELQYRYGIKNGFIVDEVIQYSDAEKLGVRRGDVIVSFSGMSSCYQPQFEDFLLSIGLDSLRGMITVSDFKLEVYNLLQKVKRTITLPVQLSDTSEY
ncbi:unnamed protein product [Urochloa humidicola]